MQAQQSQRNKVLCGSGVQRRKVQTVASVTPMRSENKNFKTGGYVAALRLPNNPFSFNLSVFKIIIAIALSAIVLYLYMVVSIIVATVDRKSLEERVREESTELTYSETEYSKLVGSITLASARASGYIDANNSGFATRAEAATLTLNNE